MTQEEVDLLALLKKEGQVQTDDKDSIRGLELRGLVERCGGGVVRYVEPKRAGVPPAKRLEALKAALKKEPLSRKEAVDIMGEYRYLWFALQDGGVVRLFSGDYAIPGGAVTRHVKNARADCIRRAIPVGYIMNLQEIVGATGMEIRDVKHTLENLCQSGEVTRVGRGEYTR